MRKRLCAAKSPHSEVIFNRKPLWEFGRKGELGIVLIAPETESEAKEWSLSEESRKSLMNCPCTGVNLPRLLQPALLYIIAQEPAHGYAIMQKLSASGLFGESGPDSAGVYRFLKSMENDGSLYASWDTSESGPARKRYEITPRGLACLNQWRKTLLEHQEFISLLLDFMRS